jgi:hypothetical protein
MGADELPPGVELLQNAALQLIGAAKAFLDVAERVVQDPRAVAEVAATIGAVAKAAIESIRPAAHDDEPAPPDDVQHIDIR